MPRTNSRANGACDTLNDDTTAGHDNIGGGANLARGGGGIAAA